MFPSVLGEMKGQGLPVECSKPTCSAKVKKSAWCPGSENDDRSWPLSVTVQVLRGNGSTWVRGKEVEGDECTLRGRRK